MTTDALWTLADQVLAVGVQGLQTNARPGLELQYVMHGEVVPECESLIVNVGQLFLGSTREQAAFDLSTPRAIRRFATLEVFLFRCVPNLHDDGSTATVAELNEASEKLHKDAWALFTTYIDAARQGTFSDTCRDVDIRPATPFGPEGGIAGWRFEIVVQL